MIDKKNKNQQKNGSVIGLLTKCKRKAIDVIIKI